MPSALGIVASGYQDASGGGPWTPASLPTLVAWYDAADAATITASGGSVSQWVSKAPAGSVYSQATAALQPATGTRTVNGHNALDFVPGQSLAGPAWSRTAGPRLYFLIYVGDARAPRDECPVGADGALGTWRSDSFDSNGGPTGDQRQAFHDGAWRIPTGQPVRTYGPAVQTLAMQYTAANTWTSYVGGIQTGGAVAGSLGATASGTGEIASSYNTTYGIDGAVCELIVADVDAVASGDLAKLQTYATTKWGTPPPASPPVAGYAAWLDAADLATLTVDTSNRISQWRNKGTGADFEQPVLSLQPSANVFTVNGHHAVQFGRYNLAETQLDAVSNFSAAWTAGTLFVVSRVDQQGGAGGATHQWGGGGDSWAPYQGGIYDWFGTTARSAYVTPSFAWADLHMFTVVAAPNDWRAYGNGTLDYSTAVNVSDVPAAWSQLPALGANTAGGYLVGALCEVIAYPAALNDVDRVAVEGYLRAKWGTPEPPPWTPAELTGLSLWLDATDPATLTVGTGAQVTQWADKSGHGNHMTQPAATSQPSTGYAIGGHNALYFDVGQYVGNAAMASAPTSRFFAAVVAHDVGSTGESSAVGPFSYGQEWRVFSWGAGGGQSLLDANVAGHTPPGQPAPPAFGIAWAPWMQYDAGTVTAYRGGAAVGSPLTGVTYPNGAGVNIGYYAGVSLLARAIEVILVDGPVSDEDRAALWSYLTAKYGELA